MSLDTKQFNRSVYSVLDFLGDVGGLLSILLPIGGALISLLDELFNQTLDSYIIKTVFFNSRKPNNSEQTELNEVSRKQNL